MLRHRLNRSRTILHRNNLIAVDPANADGLVPVLQKATDAGIPIVFFDNNADYEDIVSYVTWDSYRDWTDYWKISS